MRTIRVQRTLHAPAERVFDVLADHAGYTRFSGVKSAKVLRPGQTDPNGLGALREISTGFSWFQEEITVFDRPRRLEYRIVRGSMPIEHDLGRIDIEPTNDGVEVTWTSTFRIALPVIGGLLTTIAVRQMGGLFSTALAAVETYARA